MAKKLIIQSKGGAPYVDNQKNLVVFTTEAFQYLGEEIRIVRIKYVQHPSLTNLNQYLSSTKRFFQIGNIQENEIKLNWHTNTLGTKRCLDIERYEALWWNFPNGFSFQIKNIDNTLYPNFCISLKIEKRKLEENAETICGEVDGIRLNFSSQEEGKKYLTKINSLWNANQNKTFTIKGVDWGKVYFREWNSELQLENFGELELERTPDATEPPPIPENTKPPKSTTTPPPETTGNPPHTENSETNGTPETSPADVYDTFEKKYAEESELGECVSKYIKEDKETARAIFLSLVSSGSINEKHLSPNRHVIKYSELEKTLKELYPTSQTDSSSGTPGNNDISKTRSSVIWLINKTLKEEPEITENELSAEYHYWEAKINSLNDRREITNFMEGMTRAINAKRKAKAASQKVNDNVEDMKDKSGEELNEKIKENDQNQGTQGYEDKKGEIETEKKRAAHENAENYRNNTALPTIKKWMDENGVSENELDNKTKSDYEKLKNGEINQPDDIVAKEMEIKNSIGVQGAEKKITELENKVKAVLKTGDKKEIEKLKRKIKDFINTDNIYYDPKKSVAVKLLNQLNNYRSTQTNSPDKFPLKIIVPVLLVGVSIIAALVIISKKKKKES